MHHTTSITRNIQNKNTKMPRLIQGQSIKRYSTMSTNTIGRSNEIANMFES